MPSRKPAEFGEIILPSFYNGSLACAPSVFQSEYDYGNSFYSFEAGLVHFIFVNPYTPSHKNSKQFNFLVSDFKSVDRYVTPWVVVLTHCPLYSSNMAHYRERQAIEMKVRKIA